MSFAEKMSILTLKISIFVKRLDSILRIWLIDHHLSYLIIIVDANKRVHFNGEYKSVRVFIRRKYSGKMEQKFKPSRDPSHGTVKNFAILEYSRDASKASLLRKLLRRKARPIYLARYPRFLSKLRRKRLESISRVESARSDRENRTESRTFLVIRYFARDARLKLTLALAEFSASRASLLRRLLRRVVRYVVSRDFASRTSRCVFAVLFLVGDVSRTSRNASKVFASVVRILG